MKCILVGHRPVVEQGRSGKGWVKWCPDCGLELDRGGEPERPAAVEVRAMERRNVQIQ